MLVDRYIKIILTVIAVELLWIGIKDGAPAALAQAQQEGTPVIIRGIDLPNADPASLPVVAIRPLRVDTGRLSVTIDGPIKVEADRPLPVRSVQYTPAPRPGE